MDKMERLFKLRSLLDGRRSPITLSDLAERMECSPATAKRAIRELRSGFDAPVVYDKARGGYLYASIDGESRVELPGLWFGAEELAALVTLREVLTRLEPGLLGEALAPLTRRLDRLLSHRSLGLTEAARRIRVLSQQGRAPGPFFGAVAKAVLSRRTLAFRYASRADDRVSDRTVSPQRLTRYRGCWYLDAWCHDREGLRTFAVERIDGARTQDERARTIPDADLDAHYAAAYGIFAGPATHTAVLRIAPRRARWVADENWHPRQSGSFGADGSYELRVPYGRPDELVLDVLRLGSDAEIIGPGELRKEVAKRLKEAGAIYAPGRVARRSRTASVKRNSR